MTRWKLPDALGGGEVTDVERDPALQLWGHPAHLLRTDDGIELVMQRRSLTEIPPPIPAEPEPGAYLIGGVICARPKVANVDGRWIEMDGCDWSTWAGLWEEHGGPGVTITPLVAIPEVKLPWIDDDGPMSVRLLPDNDVKISLWLPSVELGPDEADALGFAVLSAARAARSKP